MAKRSRRRRRIVDEEDHADDFGLADPEEAEYLHEVIFERDDRKCRVARRPTAIS